jgi:anti-sigma B factor antagonist
MSCKFKLRRRHKLPVLQIIGEIAANDAAKVSRKMDALCKNAAPKVVIDLSETSFIDSYGLGIFVYCWKMLDESNRELIFLNPRDAVSKVFSGSNLDHIFNVVATLDEL